MTQHAIVALTDGTITSITLDKYLASRMTIIEECEAGDVEEKVGYWTRIYNHAHQMDVPMYHFYNERLNKHVWSIHSDVSKLPVRFRNEYKLIETPEQTNN